MEAAEVRRFALSLPETVEGEHGHRPAFRVSNRLFAVIEPGDLEILVLVTADERQALTTEAPKTFEAILDKRGETVQEWVTVHLAHALPQQVCELLEDGWRRFAPKRALAVRDRM
jgi:hypothetical protein